MLSCSMGFAALAAFEHTPYPPTPFHPRQGGKGGLTATWDFVAPNALLRSQGRHCSFVQRLLVNGRRDLAAAACANGERVAARVRCKELGVVARAQGERAAPRWLRANPFASTTTAGSPTLAPTSATQPHARSTVFGAQSPNRYSAPLSALARVERGWGIGGELNTSRQRKITGENT
jgi:hypothetical protein